MNRILEICPFPCKYRREIHNTQRLHYVLLLSTLSSPIENTKLAFLHCVRVGQDLCTGWSGSVYELVKIVYGLVSYELVYVRVVLYSVGGGLGRHKVPSSPRACA